MELTEEQLVAIDDYRHIVHVMDVHKATEDISTAVRQLEPTLLKDHASGEGWSWFLYDKHGNVCDYRDGQYYMVPLADERIYPSFIGSMLECANHIWLEGCH